MTLSLRTSCKACVALAALLYLAVAHNALAQTTIVGWIEPAGAGSVAGTARAANASGANGAAAVRITRNGGTVAYDANDGLRDCDKLKLVDPNAVVRITLTNKERLRLDARTQELDLPCAQTGMTTQLATFLRALWSEAETRRISATAAASRTGRMMPPPSIPALVGDKSEIAAGERALYVGWKGGEAPFAIELRRHDNNALVAASKSVSARSATLPRARIVPGRHVVVITDGAGKVTRDEQLFVVDRSAVPPPPRGLVEASIPDTVRTLYYADFLAGFEDGRFCLEALQQAASIAPQTVAAREWLKGWGDPE